MHISELEITTHFLKKVVTESDLSAVKRPTCDEYAMLFYDYEFDEQTSDTARFLTLVCGWSLCPDDRYSPFECRMGNQQEREYGWKHVTNEQIEAIADATDSIHDPELKARLADLVWLKLKRHEYGRLAAVSYIESAERLMRQGDILGEKARLFRGVDLAAQIDRQGPLMADIIDRIMKLLSTPKLSNCSLADCMDALLRSKSGDRASCHDIAKKRARFISTNEPNPNWERRFWELAAAFAARIPDETAERDANIEVAKTFETEADNVALNSVKAQFLELALHQYRKISDTDDERDRVHRELLKAQEKIPKEMFPIESDPLDISEMVSQARNRVRGKDKIHAVAELVLASRWPSKSEVRDEAISQIKSYPLQNIFAGVRFSSSWKTSAKSPGTSPATDDVPEESLHAKMCEHYRYFIPITTQGYIEPIRHELLLGHTLMLDDMLPFILYSPLVPQGRETFFALGIHAGLQGRFIEALHILVPQLEHMIRCILAQQGIITSSLDQKGIQKEKDLNSILQMPETETTFGEDLCFVLRVVFVEQWGFNLRNELSHGMLSPGFFFSETAVYAWWLITRIVCGHVAVSLVDQSSSQDNEESPGI